MFKKKKLPQKQNNVLEKIKKIISENIIIYTGEITENTSLYNDLGLDEIDLFEFIMQIEEEFEVEIDLNLYDLKALKTVGDVMQVLASVGVQ